MRGISGSGKSTYVKNNYPDAVVCSADSFFMRKGQYKFDPNLLYKAHGMCKKAFVAALNRGVKVIVVDNTNTMNKEMKFYITEALSREGVEIEVVRLTTPVNVAANRNVHGVPAEVVQKMSDRMQDLNQHWLDTGRVRETIV